MKLLVQIAVHFLLFSFILINNAFSQEEKLKEILTGPVVLSDCEVFSLNLPGKTFDYQQIGSIAELIDLWEKECGVSEPLLRLKILTTIQSGIPSDSLIKMYMQSYSDIIYNRIADSRESNFEEIFGKNRSYYSYIPLQSGFDSLSVRIAKNLMEEKKLSEDEKLICILFSFDMDLFEQSIESKEYRNAGIVKYIAKQEYDIHNENIIYTLILGSWTPLNAEHKTFNTSPQLGIWIGTAVGKISLDLGIVFRLNINDNEFEIKANSDIVTTKSDIGFFIGGLIAYELYSKKEWKILPNFGIGYDLIDTNAIKESSSEEGDEYYSISAINLSIGIRLVHTIFIRNYIGIGVNYHYVPYHFDNNSYTSFGADYLTINIIYKF